LSVTGILGLLLDRGIRLKADGDRLVVTAPPGAVTEELAATIRTHKTAILAVLREIADSGDARQAIPTTQLPEATGTVSLSQERIWTVTQLHPGTVHYCLTDACWLRGPLDEAALERAVQGVCDRHSLMRARFIAADGVQVRIETVEHRILELERIDLSDQPVDRIEAIATERMEALAMVPFDPGTDFLVRTYLFRLGGDNFLFYVVTHSIIWDAPSFEILLDEIGTLYEQNVGVSSKRLADLSIRYDDYAWWQRERHRSPEILAGLQYWRRQLAGDLSPLTLPVDTVPLIPAEPRGARYNFIVPDELASRIFAYCKASGVTPFMVLLSGYVLLLSRYADSERVVITAAVQGRDDPQLERMIGTFTNHLLLKFEVDESRSFEGLVGYVKDLALDGFAHQQCAVEAVIDELDVDLGHSCLFQLNFTYRRADSRARTWADLEVAEGPSRNAHAIHGDLTFWIDETSESMVAGIDYRADMFTEATIARLVGRLFGVLEQGLARPDAPVRDISSAAHEPDEHRAEHAFAPASGTPESGLPDGERRRRAQELTRRLGLEAGDCILLADRDHADDLGSWQWAASLVGATVSVPSKIAQGDEWDLYREVRESRPRILVTTVPMAAALTALDFAARLLAETRLVVMPVHARPSVLRSLAQSFDLVYYVLHTESIAGPLLLGSGSRGDEAVCFEPLVQVSVRVLDRFGRICPAGIDGDVEVCVEPESCDDRWIGAGFRGRWLDDKRIRVSSWQDIAALRGRVDMIETGLSRLPGIQDYHVELRRADTGEARLLVWVQQAFGEERTSSELREALGSALDGLRCPIMVIDVGSIPRRSDGRVVAALLDDPFADVHAAGFELPGPGTESALAEIWSEILGIERIGAHDSFAELGGSSLQALRVIQRMEARLGWRVEPRLLFFQSLRRVAGRAPEHADKLGQAA
jgi:hypothetical protein